MLKSGLFSTKIGDFHLEIRESYPQIKFHRIFSEQKYVYTPKTSIELYSYYNYLIETYLMIYYNKKAHNSPFHID